MDDIFRVLAILANLYFGDIYSILYIVTNSYKFSVSRFYINKITFVLSAKLEVLQSGHYTT